MFRDLLISNWRPESTSGLDPNIPPHEPNGLTVNRGWYNTVDYDPAVTLSGFREPISSGGNSGYTGIDPSGDGPTQTRLGRGNADVFAEGDREYGTDALDASEMAFRIRQEIEDIIHAAEAANDDADRDVAVPEPWTHVSSAQEFVPNDTQVTPVVHRQRARANYSWVKMP
jgi:hypothetical protein